MKKYRVEIKPAAENDLIRRYQQIAEDSPQNAVNWYLGIIDAIEKLDILNVVGFCNPVGKVATRKINPRIYFSN